MMAIMKDNEFGQRQYEQVLEISRLAPTLLVLFKPMLCLCWWCQWDPKMGENWFWDWWAESDLCPDSTSVQSCACVAGLSLEITAGDNWMYLEPTWTFFRLLYKSTTWAREKNKRNPHCLRSCFLQLSLGGRAMQKAKKLFFLKCS